MLREARAKGSLDVMIAGLMSDPTESEFELLSEPGTMSDASKRRMASPPPKLEKEHVMSGSVEQKQHVGASPHSYGLKLPMGIASVDQWGCTLLEVGKYGKEGFAYEDLASSSQAAHLSYCNWLLTQKFRVDLTPPIKDLIRRNTMINVEFCPDYATPHQVCG
eukprot:s4004_g6.t1